MQHGMEQWKEEAPATSPKAPKIRNKLQKSISRQPSNSRRQESPKVVNTIVTYMPQEIIDDPKSLTQPRIAPSPPTGTEQSRPCIRREGHSYEDDGYLDWRPAHTDRLLDPPELLKPETYMDPGFSHPIRHNSPPQPSSDPKSMFSSLLKMKRRAATAKSSVGQPEATQQLPNTLCRTSSVDLIAEQYRAMLEFRNSSPHENPGEDSGEDPIEDPSEDPDEDLNGPEPAPTPQDTETDEWPMISQQRSWDHRQPETPTSGDPTRMAELPGPSPISDAGTLVSYQNEALYFKPLSYSPELKPKPAPTSAPEPEPEPPSIPLSRQTSADDNIGLQISLDLLTHDLSSALSGRPCRSSKGTSALQVWVMIEAYERLWEHVSELSETDQQAKQLQDMFHMWLKALYRIHGNMSGDAKDEYASGNGGDGE